MPFKALAIANEFIELAQRSGKQLTPMKLQKLVYYAHGWYLALEGKPLLNEEVEAWQYGPVVPSLFHDLKEYGNQPVSGLVGKHEFEDAPLPSGNLGFTMIWVVPRLNEDNEDESFAKLLIGKVWELYGGYSAAKLSNMTHAPGGPWHRTVEESGGLTRNKDIDRELIRSHFIGLMNGNG